MQAELDEDLQPADGAEAEDERSDGSRARRAAERRRFLNQAGGEAEADEQRDGADRADVPQARRTLPRQSAAAAQHQLEKWAPAVTHDPRCLMLRNGQLTASGRYRSEFRI